MTNTLRILKQSFNFKRDLLFTIVLCVYYVLQCLIAYHESNINVWYIWSTCRYIYRGNIYEQKSRIYLLN